MSDESRPQPAQRLPDTGFRSFSAYRLARADIGLEWKIAAPSARARRRNEFDAMARRREDAICCAVIPDFYSVIPGKAGIQRVGTPFARPLPA